MSDRIYLGRRISGAVDDLRKMRGRWPLDVDPRLSGKSWEHIQAVLNGHSKHTDDGILIADRTVECVGWDTVDPWHPEQILGKVYDADFCHWLAYTNENLCAQGVAVYTKQVHDGLYVLFCWKGQRQ